MSKVLVVHGYYDETGEYGKVLDGIKSNLLKNDIKAEDIEVINPFAFCQEIFTHNKHDKPIDTAQWYRGIRTEKYDELLKEHRDKILNANLIIFYFPIWWEVQPPLMQQWVSDVFRSESFKVIEGKPVAQWGSNHKAMVITTSGFTDEVKDQNFLKLLKMHKLDHLAGVVSAEDLKKLMNMSEGYQVSTALTYAGMPLIEQTHVNNVQSGSDPHLVSALKDGVALFIDAATPKSKNALLLSGGPSKQDEEDSELSQARESYKAKTPKVKL